MEEGEVEMMEGGAATADMTTQQLEKALADLRAREAELLTGREPTGNSKERAESPTRWLCLNAMYVCLPSCRN